MLKFETEGSKLIAKVSVATSKSTWTLDIERQCDSEFSAQLQRDKMATTLWEMLKQIRQESYLRGFKDAKSKRAKMNYFSGSL